jgi:pimeloyl-ACP methyl ester carboxylesterase
MATKTLLIFALLLSLFSAKSQDFSKVTFSTYKSDLAFNCVAVDSANNIWGGTSGKGLWKLQYFINNYVPFNFSGTNGSFDKFIIKGLAANKDRGVWVAHEGFNGSPGSGGGIDYVNALNGALRDHYFSISNININNNKGCPSRRTQGIAIDKNGTVWSSHTYHDLTVTGPPSGTYRVTPGGVGYKKTSMPVFDTVVAITPYADYTIDPPITVSPGTRVCTGLGIDNKNNEVWSGVASYNGGGAFQGSRIVRCDLNGNVLGYLNEASGLPLGSTNSNARANAIGFDTARNLAWVGFNLGKGIAVRVAGVWTVKYPSVLPAGALVNQNAIAVSTGGEVYFGTSAGLLIYRGVGAFSADTSYVLLKTQNGLPSNNVTGVAIDRDGNVWVSTSVGLAKMTRSDFTVYNLTHPQKDKERDAPRYAIICATQKDRQCNGDLIELNVAADSSSTTMIVYTGPNPQSKVIRMTGATVANAYYTPEYGFFREIVRNIDSVVYVYQHPAYVYNGSADKFVSYNFSIKDSITLLNAVEGKIRIYHPPVLMVHGVWSSTKSFEDMENAIYGSSGNYERYQLLRRWFASDRHDEFFNPSFVYKDQIPLSIDMLLQQCRENKLSAGKVNYVGHSRGGLFGRYYLQSTFSGYDYRNDLNKLITINTPHSGSQTANLIMDKRTFLFGTLEVGSTLGGAALESYDDKRGAKELKVNDPAITSQLNGSGLNKNKVPTHAIATRYLFGALSRADILKVLLVNGATRIPYVGNLILFMRLYALSLGTLCVEGPIDNCLKEIYNGEESDIVVPLSSQKGGLPPAATTFFGDDLAHSNKKVALFGLTVIDAKGVLGFNTVHQRVISLLRENPDAGSSSFTKAGYNPPQLQYTFLPGIAGSPDGRPSVASLSINPALAGSTYQYGDTVQVTVTGSAEVKTLLAAYTGVSLADAGSDVEPNNSFTFPYPIPKEATGRINIKVYGFDGTGMIAADSSYINIGIPVTATLDSIRVIGRENTFIVPKNDSIQLRVKAYYSDTVREVTYMPGFTYAFFENNVAPSKYGIKGVNTGFDRVILTYQGKLDTIYVQVPLSIGPGGVIPVRWVSFKGNRTSAGNQLTWTTATEENNSHYEVEHSTNGSVYTKLAAVNSSGNSSNLQAYQYLHGISTPGNHYYRIKQVDKDGNFTYTGVVLIKILEKNSNSITIYPNPAKNTVFIGFENIPALPYTIKMVSPLGQVLLTKTITQASNQEDLDISKLPKGLYYLHIADDKKRMLFNNKIVVQ